MRLVMLLVISFLIAQPTFGESMWVDETGYHIDGRGQVEEPAFLPPHPEMIPQAPLAIQETVDFESYYKTNFLGERRADNRLAIVPGYNAAYSERHEESYRKQDYINVWCDGRQHVGRVDCLTDKYAISFYPVSAWSAGITSAKWRARGLKQEGVAFLYIDSLSVDAPRIREAKKWADLLGVKVLFGTIDAGISIE